MYLDSKGLVTVGIGHLISTLADAQKLPFYNAKNTKAPRRKSKPILIMLKSNIKISKRRTINDLPH